MPRLIRTRQGSVAYAVAPPIVFGLLVTMLLFGSASPFSASVLVEWQTVFLLLTAWMAFALPALGVLARDFVLRRLSGRTLDWHRLLLLPMVVLLWFPAALLCLPMYAVNLVCLARRRYPEGQSIRWRPLLLLAAVLVCLSAVIGLSERRHRSQPAPTAAEAFSRYAPETPILAEIPRGEDAVLLIALDGAGVFVRQEAGWVLDTPYQNSDDVLPGAAVMRRVCRNPEGGEDVVLLRTVHAEDGQPPQPRDTAGSAFVLVSSAPLGFATEYAWYTIVDADAPDYAVTME